VLPCGLALAADLLLGFFPLLTIAAIVIVFPIATVVICRAALQELQRVIDQVAPPAPPAAVTVDMTAEQSNKVF
jgi:hypothetical protein